MKPLSFILGETFFDQPCPHLCFVFSIFPIYAAGFALPAEGFGAWHVIEGAARIANASGLELEATNLQMGVCELSVVSGASVCVCHPCESGGNAFVTCNGPPPSVPPHLLPKGGGGWDIGATHAAKILSAILDRVHTYAPHAVGLKLACLICVAHPLFSDVKCTTGVIGLHRHWHLAHDGSGLWACLAEPARTSGMGGCLKTTWPISPPLPPPFSFSSASFFCGNPCPLQFCILLEDIEPSRWG